MGRDWNQEEGKDKELEMGGGEKEKGSVKALEQRRRFQNQRWMLLCMMLYKVVNAAFSFCSTLSIGFLFDSDRVEVVWHISSCVWVSVRASALLMLCVRVCVCTQFYKFSVCMLVRACACSFALFNLPACWALWRGLEHYAWWIMSRNHAAGN